MPTDGPARPHPKSKQLLRSKPKYRRHVAGPKQWQAIVNEKAGPCRACTAPGRNGHDLGRITFHHIVSREDFGDDVADNIVPLHEVCHANVTQRRGRACANLLTSLTDSEYSYMVERGGEGYAERAYGLVYSR